MVTPEMQSIDTYLFTSGSSVELLTPGVSGYPSPITFSEYSTFQEGQSYFSTIVSPFSGIDVTGDMEIRTVFDINALALT